MTLTIHSIFSGLRDRLAWVRLGKPCIHDSQWTGMTLGRGAGIDPTTQCRLD